MVAFLKILAVTALALFGLAGVGLAVIIAVAAWVGIMSSRANDR